MEILNLGPDKKLEQGKLSAETTLSAIGNVLDVVGPIAIQFACYFGGEAYVNSGPGTLRIQFGIGMFLRLVIVSFGIYFFVFKPILRAAFPKWWGRS